MTHGRSHHQRGVHTIAPMGPRTLGQHKEYYTSREPHEECPVCGVVIRDHARCAACRVLVGYGHSDASNPDGLCEGCQTQRDSGDEGAALVAEAIEENKKWQA